MERISTGLRKGDVVDDTSIRLPGVLAAGEREEFVGLSTPVMEQRRPAWEMRPRT